MRNERVEEFRVETCDEVVVEFLLARLAEDIPGEVVHVPGMVEPCVAEVEGYCALRFGERCYVQVGAE